MELGAMAAAHGLPVRELLSSGGAADRLFTIPVEGGAEVLHLALTHTGGETLWLYAVDPEGEQHTARVATSFFQRLDIDDPTPGEWKVLLVRPDSARPVAFDLVVSADNPRLRVSGALSAQPQGGAVPLQASARYGMDLSGVAVEALITDPEGLEHLLELVDDSDHRGRDEPESGTYRALFHASVPGRHRVRLRFVDEGDGVVAKPLYQFTHCRYATGSLDPLAEPFERELHFTFELDADGLIIDDDDDGDTEDNPDAPAVPGS